MNYISGEDPAARENDQRHRRTLAAPLLHRGKSVMTPTTVMITTMSPPTGGDDALYLQVPRGGELPG